LCDDEELTCDAFWIRRYTASIDDRAYIPVYEFPLEHQGVTQYVADTPSTYFVARTTDYVPVHAFRTIMIDSDTGFVLWTAIWKALGNNKGQSSV
jgi:hypothetical protein